MSRISRGSERNMLTQFQLPSRHVYEPQLSDTSLTILREEDDDEDGTIQEPVVRLESVEKQVLHYQMMRSIQMLLCGDPIGTVTQLNILYDLELDSKFIQDILIKYRGVEIMTNLLEVRDPRCIVASLRILKKLANNNRMRWYETNLGIVKLLVNLLSCPNIDVLILASKTLSELCKIQKPARFLRKEGGIPLILDLINLDDITLNTSTELLSETQKKQLKLAIAGTETLKEIAKYPKSVNVLHKSGFLLCTKKITDCCHRDLLTEMFELLAHCAEDGKFRIAIETQGILLTLLQGLQENVQRLRAACAKTIAKCASDSELTCHIVRMLGGLNAVVDLTKDVRQEHDTLAGLTLAVAKLAQDNRNLKIMSERGLTFNLIKFIKFHSGDDEILSNVMEGLAECGRLEENRSTIARADVLPTAIMRLMGNDPRVLSAAAMCLGTCARSPEVAQRIMELDGFRMLNTTDSAEEVRSIVGGLGLLTKLLLSKDKDVKVQACGLVAEISQDEENLHILSDCGLVLQDLATVVLRNMRTVALSAEDKALKDGRMDVFQRMTALPRKPGLRDSEQFNRGIKDQEDKMHRKRIAKGKI
ncbi:Armadillo repeat-containing protein, putative [Gryllus bimaculatus]|nr:Armadillo repeat-containing protein, putative [Gryllus bimaculatus]